MEGTTDFQKLINPVSLTSWRDYAIGKACGDSFHPVLLLLFLPLESQNQVFEMVTVLPAEKTERKETQTETHRMFVTQRMD